MSSARRVPLPALAGLIAGLLLVVALPPSADSSTPAPAPPTLVGYNDDFNIFELHTAKKPSGGGFGSGGGIPKLDDGSGSGGPLPIPLPLPGTSSGNGEKAETGSEADASAEGDAAAEADEPEQEPGLHAAGEELINRAREGGADVIRYAVPWKRVERDRGTLDFTVEDETYQMAVDAGLQPVIVLLTAPCWAHPSIACNAGHRAVRPDADFRDEFARFAKAAIERYPKAAAFEIWNESNSTAFWGTKPTPRSYVNLLKVVAGAVAGTDHPPLLFNGPVPKPQWYDYIKRAYQGFNAGDLVDGTALHPYGNYKGALAVRDKIRRVKVILRKAEAPRAVWVTEIGWSTNSEAQGAVSPAEQARRISRLERVAISTRLRAVIIHRLRDVAHADPWEAGLGALQANDIPKPVFCDLSLRQGFTAPRGC